MKTLLLLLILAATVISYAQAPAGLAKTWKGPDMALLRKILAESPADPGPAKPVQTSPVKFTPTGNSGVPRALAEAFGRNADEVARLTEAFEQIKQGYNADVAKEGKANDLAAAMTFFLAANVTAFHKTDMPSDAEGEKLYNSIASAMASTTATMSNAEKERMYDWFVCMAGFVAMGYQDAKASGEQSAMTTVSDLARYSVKLVLGVDIEKLSVSSPPQITPAAPTKNLSGITKGTTASGGWTSSVDADFVRLTNNKIDVYLFYPFQLTDPQRGDFDLAMHCWNTIVVPRFNITSSQKFTDSVPDLTNWLYYVEGTGNAKGKQSFIAMKADSAQTGVVSVIVVVAADKQSYKQTFPDPKGLSNLKGANRFAITAEDLVGRWNESAGFGLSFVNSTTGNFAGMTTAASNDEFIFDAGGTFRNNHASATSNFGAIQGAKTSDTGRFSATDWEITLAGSRGPIVYSAYFEAVKNGRVLHITQKNASGNNYVLGLVR